MLRLFVQKPVSVASKQERWAASIQELTTRQGQLSFNAGTPTGRYKPETERALKKVNTDLASTRRKLAWSRIWWG